MSAYLVRNPLSSGQFLLATILLLTAFPTPTQPPRQPTREILITGLDYAFQAPDSAPPGPVLLRFRNAGQVRHEVAVALLKPGITLARVAQSTAAGGRPDSLIEGVVGILIAGPGATALGSLTTEFLPGRTYGLVCNFQDAPDKPRHMALGMVHELRISGP
jgi:hypothetical protein